MERIWERFLSTKSVSRFLKEVEGDAPISVKGVVGSSLSFLGGGYFKTTGNSVVFILKNEEEKREILYDFSSLFPEDTFSLKNSIDFLRLKKRIDRRERFILVLTKGELHKEIPQMEIWGEYILNIREGQKFSLNRIKEWLHKNGYEYMDMVTEIGEWAFRGGIVDVFPLGYENPVRIEFFGDEIESLREFDPLTQRSIKRLSQVEIASFRKTPKSKKTILSLFPESTTIFTNTPLHLPFSTILIANDGEIDLGFVEPNIYLGNFKLLRSEIESESMDYLISYGEDYQIQRLYKLLGYKPHYFKARLHKGFSSLEEKYSLITEREIYGAPIIHPPKPKFRGLPIDDLLALHKGDYVVHLDYGIGIFEGLKRLKIDGKEKDFLYIRYAGGGRLFLPVESIGLLDRYIGSEDKPPKLDRLGGSAWLKVVKRASKAAQDYASQLLQLYARRSVAKGFSFSEDTKELLELEATFPYEETEDQLKALKEVKEDMVKSKPMDRLICGDVGYGKTELALRAAFKAVMDFKQVALLAPTTILAYQHYNTFKTRLKDFPVRVAMLSRFIPKREREGILRDLRKGLIDIVIGTHMLLSDKVVFKDLGLLIVDEEQRFGVRQKEKIKERKTSVDVLTLTATPIPRTLYMSLVGLRDISTIRTPPPGRKGIITEVHHWDDSLIREWIIREISRGGQVFFIHNRVQTIYSIAHKLKTLLPDLKLGIAHGQMRERELAEVYLDFRDGKYDILLSTAIIESGLDFPKVNTIIVNRADRFGLSDLHQLRGRVGRSEKQAYALFLIPDERKISREAKKRLSAILAYSKLGSGFKLALRDMEIRGAGNLLGPEQHGHIARVGFNLYCRLLKEAVARLKKQKIVEEPKLEIDVEAYIPSSYVQDSFERVALYKRLLGVEEKKEIDSLREELEDRFGHYPEIVENLFNIAEIRLYARLIGARRVALKGKRIVIETSKEKIETQGSFNDLKRILMEKASLDSNL